MSLDASGVASCEECSRWRAVPRTPCSGRDEGSTLSGQCGDSMRTHLSVLALFQWLCLSACTADEATDTEMDGGSQPNTGTCDVIQSGAGRVIIGFWTTSDCSGDPVNTNSFPVEPTADCYCWPGHSGENSAQAFSCNGGDGSFSYDQYVSLDCATSGATATTKTSWSTACEQDIPPTLYSRILDYSACTPG